MKQMRSLLLICFLACLAAPDLILAKAAAPEDKPSAEAVRAAREAELDEARMSQELDFLSAHEEMPDFHSDEPVSPHAVLEEESAPGSAVSSSTPKSSKIPRASIPQVVLMDAESSAQRSPAAGAPACLPPGTYVRSQSCDSEEYFPTDTIQHDTQSWSNCCSGTVQKLCTRPGLSRHNPVTCL
jgi:hypothetical protein